VIKIFANGIRALCSLNNPQLTNSTTKSKDSQIGDPFLMQNRSIDYRLIDSCKKKVENDNDK